jgi:hypothetical protein
MIHQLLATPSALHWYVLGLLTPYAVSMVILGVLFSRAYRRDREQPFAPTPDPAGRVLRRLRPESFARHSTAHLN